MSDATAEITRKSASELAELIARGDLSSAEVVEAHIARIEKVNPLLNAVVVPMFDSARSAARAADAAPRGGSRGPLHGVPITIKESFDVIGTPTTAGIEAPSRQVASADAPLVTRLRQAGAIILGKTNVPQLLMFNETDNPVYGRTNNPWNVERAAGGSSGGEAAIIAAGGSPLGLGSDIAGSNRLPAHVCGINGLKPTSGRLTMLGHAPCFAVQEGIVIQAGPLARTVADLNLAMSVLAAPGQDVIDPSIAPVPWANPEDIAVDKLRIAVFTDNGLMTPCPAIARAVREAAAGLRSYGATVEDWAPPDYHEGKALTLSLFYGDGLRGAKRLLGRSRRDPRVQKVMQPAALPGWTLKAAARYFDLIGEHRVAESARSLGPLTADDYWVLLARRARYRALFIGAIRQGRYDAVVMPPEALPAVPHGKSGDLEDSVSYAVGCNTIGLPAGVVAATRIKPDEETARGPRGDRAERAARSVEIGSAGLPVGVHVVAPPWREDVVLAVMAVLENYFRSQPGYPARPPI